VHIGKEPIAAAAAGKESVSYSVSFSIVGVGVRDYVVDRGANTTWLREFLVSFVS
jgi:hypothetical protein